MIDFSVIKKMLHDMASSMRTIDQNIAAKVKMINELKTAPLAYEDMDTVIDAIFEKRTEDYRQTFEHIVREIANQPMLSLDQINIEGELHGFKFIAFGLGGTSPQPATMERALAALLKEPLKKAIKENARKVDLGQPGPALAKRLPMIADLEKELAALKEQKAKMHAEAREAGLTI